MREYSRLAIKVGMSEVKVSMMHSLSWEVKVSMMHSLSWEVKVSMMHSLSWEVKVSMVHSLSRPCHAPPSSPVGCAMRSILL